MVAAIILKAGSSEVFIEDLEPTLGNLQSIVGGYIEAVTLNNATLYCNEEGKLHGLPFNGLATAFVHEMGFYDLIVGDVVIFGPPENGEDTNVRSDIIHLMTAIQRLRITPLEDYIPLENLED